MQMQLNEMVTQKMTRSYTELVVQIYHRKGSIVQRF